MIINTAKKAILLLSIISLHASVFGMLERAQNKISTLILSQKQQVAITILAPLTVVGCFLLVQNKDYVLSLLDNIPAPSEKVIFGLAAAAAMPTTFVLAGKFSPEEQFQLSHRNYTEIEKHQILQNKAKLAQFIAGKQTVQFDEGEKPITFQQYINNNFSDKVDSSLYPNTKAANELCDLERRINAERQRLQQIPVGEEPTWFAVTKEGKPESVTISEQLDQLRKEVLFIHKFRGLITNSPEYNTEQERQAAIKKNQLTQEQITFSTKIAAFVPMFTQPVSVMCMLFLGMLFAKFGINIE